MFVQPFVQIANKEISKVRVTVPLWWESTVIGGSPHKRRVTWKMLLFDDVIMDWRIPWRDMYHITQYTHCTTAINQTMPERGRNVGIPLASLLSLSSIPKDNDALCKEQRDYRLVGCGRWAPKVTKGLTGSFAGKTFEVFTRFKPDLVCPVPTGLECRRRSPISVENKWSIVNRI